MTNTNGSSAVEEPTATEIDEIATVLEISGDEERVLEWMADDMIYPFASLAWWTGLPGKRVAKIVRNFKDRGWAKIGSAYDEDTGRVHGRGYYLTAEGAKVQAARAALTSQQKVDGE